MLELRIAIISGDLLIYECICQFNVCHPEVFNTYINIQ